MDRGKEPAVTDAAAADAIESQRLRLVSVGPDFMRAVLEGRTHDAEALAGAPLPREWLADAEPLVRLRLRQLEEDPGAQPWLLRLLVLARTGELIGHINFHEPPRDRDWVEIGYSILPAHQRRGYATEAAHAMFRWAASRGVRCFRASVSPQNEASLGMVAKMGFRRIGVQWDDVDGEEIVFEAARDVVLRSSP